MKIIICGGRYFKDVPLLWGFLDRFVKGLPEPGVREVIDGASDDITGPYLGADYWGHQWALARNYPTSRLHAKWDALGRRAGPVRNAEMLVRFGKVDYVIATPGNRGTQDMKTKATAAGVRVLEVF